MGINNNNDSNNNSVGGPTLPPNVTSHHGRMSSNPSSPNGDGSSSMSPRNFPGRSGGHKHRMEEEPLYRARVYRFTCYGQLHLTSTNKQGTCRGYQSHFQKLMEMGPGTRSTCLQKFTGQYNPAAAFLGENPNNAASSASSSSSSSGAGMEQQMKEIYTSRTIIYKDEDETMTKEDDGAKTAGVFVHKPRKKSLLPEEELIDKTEWKQYGATQVDLLVLLPWHPWKKSFQSASSTPPVVSKLQGQLDEYQERKNNTTSKKKKHAGSIVAVTSDNMGVSVKHIDSQVGHFTVTDVGPVRICLETSSSVIPDASEDSNSNAAGAASKRPSAAAAQEEAAEKDFSLTKQIPKFYAFSGKVAERMKQNVILLRDATADDFPNRTVRFGNKFLGQFQKTTQKTFANMSKWIQSAWRDM